MSLARHAAGMSMNGYIYAAIHTVMAKQTLFEAKVFFFQGALWPFFPFRSLFLFLLAGSPPTAGGTA
jgi:hypothetical protein